MVRKAQKFDVQHLLPGHGGPGGKEVLEGQYQYMAELHKAVDDAVKQGKKLTDIVDTGTTKMVYGNLVPVNTSIKLPEKVKNWVGPFYAAHVRDTYDEITQKKPHGDLPH